MLSSGGAADFFPGDETGAAGAAEGAAGAAETAGAGAGGIELGAEASFAQDTLAIDPDINKRATPKLQCFNLILDLRN